MDFELPASDDPRRVVVREWIAHNPHPSGRVLADAGYVAPHWPTPFGLGADPVHQIIIDDELSKAGIRRPSNPIGIGWAGPTIVFAGTEEQKKNTFRACYLAKIFGVNFLASQVAEVIWRIWVHGQFVTGTSTSSMGKRFGQVERNTPSTAS